MKWDDSEYRDLNEKIIRCFYNVHDTLGPGLSEKAYHRALLIELKKHFKKVESEQEFPIYYDKVEVARFIPDIIVEKKTIIEIKAVSELNENHQAQLITQLRVSEVLIGFLINFANKKLKFMRLDNFFEIEKRNLNIK
ncbi:GxxExxY protein [Candidatus Dependentiae bacterium]|nr:GxxExxY protein [Candidatus Dependentiae bacterium]